MIWRSVSLALALLVTGCGTSSTVSGNDTETATDGVDAAPTPDTGDGADSAETDGTTSADGSDGGDSAAGSDASDAEDASESSGEGDTTDSSDATDATDAADGLDTSDATDDTDAADATDDADAADGDYPEPRVQVVVFTHIEDQTPSGPIGSTPSKTQYGVLRAKLIGLAERFKAHGLVWVLQPDWKFLEAARVYEDAATMASTGGANLFVHLRDELGVAIDPHSHENGGYNYTDVAHLLDLLGVGGSTVIGGHIWDPALPQFQHWDRFRDPVAGQKYPEATWRGDILIGSGTPNHVNDPVVSGLWRPKDKDNYWTDDPAANIVAMGAFHDALVGVKELVQAYESGTVPKSALLTASWNLKPTEILAEGGLDDIEATVIIPLEEMQAQGTVQVTDFTSLLALWKSTYAGAAYLYP